MLGVLLVVALLGTQLRCQGRRDAYLAGARDVVGTRALQRRSKVRVAPLATFGSRAGGTSRYGRIDVHGSAHARPVQRDIVAMI